MLWGGGEEIASIVADVNRWSAPMQIQTPNDLSQSRIVLKQDSTLIAVIEMSLSSWLVAGIVPGVERQPLKKLAVDESALLKLLNLVADRPQDVVGGKDRRDIEPAPAERRQLAEGARSRPIHEQRSLVLGRKVHRVPSEQF